MLQKAQEYLKLNSEFLLLAHLVVSTLVLLVECYHLIAK